ncbi:30S ribosome-binding factor RbfA [Candidatus Oleimmundimicrobium sp.]|uniref:30S ribosome-binding factor RbfA n=1 Tax=Candidatus Oleimmundimicrobium sp. TaxID=3060597 RepID=UPI002728543F|nr:30S ribosome-binding factor RbfA [Candidatus Oleimmundimicrobium sp.]MDO8885447.1 30S ribosome-binding factor RbfA [Candidatus Oleimmundimicrobium sp.]
MNYPRSNKVAKAIKEEISEILSKLKDPRIGMITVTGVDVSPDLKRAIIFISILNSSEKKVTLNVLRKAKGHIRTKLGEKLSLKFLPDLEFKWDESMERGARISEIIHRIREEEGEG